LAGGFHATAQSAEARKSQEVVAKDWFGNRRAFSVQFCFVVDFVGKNFLLPRHALPGRKLVINQITLNVQISFQQLVQNWSLVGRWTLWSVSAPTYSPVWWILVTSHSILWMIIAFGSLLMDLPELLGVKQIYYDIQGLAEPFLYKARSLSRLLSNIRHPSYVGFSLIFWITNLMR
jgi:hypothetical protein